MRLHPSPTTAARRGRAALALAGLFGLFSTMLPLAASATIVDATQAFTIGFRGEYEYGSAQPLPPEAVPLLPLFSGSDLIIARWHYDTLGAVDLNPAPEHGLYVVPGSLTLSLPELGIRVEADEISLQVEPTWGWVALYSRHISRVEGALGGATPFSISATLYTGPLDSDALPTTLAAAVSNLYVDLSGVTPARDIFIVAYANPVPEPATAALLLPGLAWLAKRARCRPSQMPPGAPRCD